MSHTCPRMAGARTAMTPTLSAVIGGFHTAEEPTPRQRWVVRILMDIVRRFHEAGGVVAVGSHFNDRATTERLPLLELEMLLEAGLSPMDVIVAATAERGPGLRPAVGPGHAGAREAGGPDRGGRGSPGRPGGGAPALAAGNARRRDLRAVGRRAPCI